jgi:hypothetical protein
VAGRLPTELCAEWDSLALGKVSTFMLLRTALSWIVAL